MLIGPGTVLGLATATLGTVPADHTWILKFLTVVNGHATTNALVDLFIRAAGVDRPWHYQESVSPVSGRRWDLWIVVGAGLEVRGRASNTSCTLMISGADLVGVSA